MKIVLVGVVSFAAGFGVAVVALKGKYLKMVNDEAALSEAHYREKWMVAHEDVDAKQPGDPTDDDWDRSAAAHEAEKEATYGPFEIKIPEGEKSPLDRILTPYATGVLIPKLEPVEQVRPPKLDPPILEEPRDETKPFILTQEEFFAGEESYEALTFTYYRGDDTLAAQNDSVISDKVRRVLIGEGVEMLRFGHLSEDPNIVYIRSHEATTDLEIALSEGKYAEEVQGL